MYFVIIIIILFIIPTFSSPLPPPANARALVGVSSSRLRTLRKSTDYFPTLDVPATVIDFLIISKACLFSTAPRGQVPSSKTHSSTRHERSPRKHAHACLERQRSGTRHDARGLGNSVVSRRIWCIIRYYTYTYNSLMCVCKRHMHDDGRFAQCRPSRRRQ